MKNTRKRFAAFLLAVLVAFSTAACGQRGESDVNLASNPGEARRVVQLFTQKGRSINNSERSANEVTVVAAEEALGLTVEYHTYRAADYQEKTYDDVTLERIRNNMDDLYMLNPDTIQILGREGLLEDLSSLECAKNLREVVLTANTVDGKLVAIPQEVVAYGLYVNQDLFDKYELELPSTPDELLECCRVFKENGIETPIGANRWWLECFVLAIGYADMYNGSNVQAEVDALNRGETRLSDYMRPGFEYLQKLIDLGYIDAAAAYTYEAIDGEGEAFLAGETPIVMAFWAAANPGRRYGSPDFTMKVIGFPSSLGQMPVLSTTGYGVNVAAKHKDDAMALVEEISSDRALAEYCKISPVISPSKNVEVDCVEPLKPLNDRINEGFYVLGANANMNVEQWGNICLIVRELLNGSSVDDCMAMFDALQAESITG